MPGFAGDHVCLTPPCLVLTSHFLSGASNFVLKSPHPQERCEDTPVFPPAQEPDAGSSTAERAWGGWRWGHAAAAGWRMDSGQREPATPARLRLLACSWATGLGGWAARGSQHKCRLDPRPTAQPVSTDSWAHSHGQASLAALTHLHGNH